MNNIFLIFGYGIPKNILKDENYNFYLKMVFNRIYDIIVKTKVRKPLVICSGGKTDIFKPYNRTEAEEIIKFLKKLRNKPFLKLLTKNWLFIAEKKSLSTLENFLNCRKIIKKRNIKKANFFIFCEQTRKNRIKILAKKMLDKNYNFQVISIDFDVSKNRYLPINYLAKKEKVELEHSLWALQNSENLKKHHKIFEEKIDYLRKAGPKAHVEAVKNWWDQKLSELKLQDKHCA
ncbi:hypothetical protein KJ992_00305 [Patescibacteria group bacterium]|nr:hypothetical protein [Patescibacteria group bacterium]